MLILLLLAAAGYLAFIRLYGFLAPNQSYGSGIMVVEGWLSDTELQKVAAQVRKGDYRAIVTSGGPLDQGGFLSEYKSYAQLAQASLQAIGVPLPVYAAPASAVRKDRTYASALAVRQWLAVNLPNAHELEVATEGPHARRTRLLYRMAFGEDYRIGIVALPPTQYDAGRWWHSSAGVRTVIGEAIAWLYAAFVFAPEEGV